jgi:UDP-2-acetamido-2-deoxy-ribo-hexuluronate aminotransferase
MQFINLKAQYERINSQIQSRITSVLDHGQYIMGPEVKLLEERLAQFVGSKHCITASSGTDTLLIAMMALDIGPGDEVITTPFTFVSTVETIVLLGAKPVFVDIDINSYNIDAHQIEKVITSRCKAIIPVSLYGQCADMDEINLIATKYDLCVIEDAAQSFGATYKNKKSCATSTIGSTSFFPSKPLGCYGDGGALFTDDDNLAKAFSEIRVHGQDRRYNHPRIGINGRLDTLQAAILLEKLDIFEDEVFLRQKVAQRYFDLIHNSFPEHILKKIKLPEIKEDRTSVFGQFTIRLQQRDNVMSKLKESGVPTAVHYPIPLNLQPAYVSMCCSDCTPNSTLVAGEVMSLPFGPYLSNEEQEKVVSSLLEATN